MRDVLLFLGCWLVLGILAAVAFGRHARRRPYLAARNEDKHDVGPDALRLLEDLDTHLDEYVAADAELADGFARLRQAVRDEQQKGDQL